MQKFAVASALLATTVLADTIICTVENPVSACAAGDRTYEDVALAKDVAWTPAQTTLFVQFTVEAGVDCGKLDLPEDACFQSLKKGVAATTEQIACLGATAPGVQDICGVALDGVCSTKAGAEVFCAKDADLTCTGTEGAQTCTKTEPPATPTLYVITGKDGESKEDLQKQLKRTFRWPSEG
jgi:hypothetical protein